jgi:hypothetical protein
MIATKVKLVPYNKDNFVDQVFLQGAAVKITLNKYNTIYR